MTANETTIDAALTEEQQSWIDGLRALADWFEQHPAVPAPAYGFVNITPAYSIGAGDALLIVEQVAPCTIERTSATGSPQLARRFGPLTLTVNVPQSLILERSEQVTVKGVSPAVAELVAGTGK